MSTYRLKGYTSEDVNTVVGDNKFNPFNQFFNAWVRDLRDDFPSFDRLVFISGGDEYIQFEVPSAEVEEFELMIAIPAGPNYIERI